MTKISDCIEVDGTRIYYEIAGVPNGEPLLMLHGGLGSMNELRPILPYLEKDYQLISLDLRGHGRSCLGVLPLTYQQYQHDVQMLLRHLQIEQYSIFGFSDGGIVGYRLAAQDAGNVSRLITLGAQWRVNLEDPSMKWLSSLTPEFWRTRFPDDVLHYEQSNPEPDFAQLVDAAKNAWFDCAVSGYPNHRVENISCPTLIMRGDNDFIFSLDEALLLNKKLTRSSFANIPDTAHASHQEAPEIVGSMINRFMSQATSRVKA